MSAVMSNFEVVVKGCTKRELGFALAIAVDGQLQRWDEIDGWFVVGWAPPDNKCGNLFPGKLSADELAPIVARWLNDHPAPRSKYPDIDGSCSQGFELVAGYAGFEDAGIAKGELEHRAGFYVEFAVRAIWAEHHK